MQRKSSLMYPIAWYVLCIPLSVRSTEDVNLPQMPTKGHSPFIQAVEIHAVAGPSSYSSDDHNDSHYTCEYSGRANNSGQIKEPFGTFMMFMNIGFALSMRSAHHHHYRASESIKPALPVSVTSSCLCTYSPFITSNGTFWQCHCFHLGCEQQSKTKLAFSTISYWNTSTKTALYCSGPLMSQQNTWFL